MSATPALARATTRVEHVLARRARDDGDAVDARDDVAGVLRVELAREDSARDDSPRAFECECEHAYTCIVARGSLLMQCADFYSRS